MNLSVRVRVKLTCGVCLGEATGGTAMSVLAGCVSATCVFARGSAGASTGASTGASWLDVVPLSCAAGGSSHTITGLGSSSDGYVKFTEITANTTPLTESQFTAGTRTIAASDDQC